MSNLLWIIPLGAWILLSLTVIPLKLAGKYRKDNVELRTKLANTIIEKPKPHIVAGKPSVKLVEFKGEDGSLDEVTISKNVYLASIVFANHAKTKVPESSAKGIWAKLQFCNKGSNEIILEVLGTWNEDNAAGNISLGDRREIELKANKLPYTLILAIKHKDDACCYAFNSESTKSDEARNPKFALNGDNFDVYVTLNGENIIEQRYRYVLKNEGKGKGLDLESYSQS